MPYTLLISEAPLAIDLRPAYRWIAFAIAQRIRPPSFAQGFAATLNAAVGLLKMMPSEWEIDLIPDRSRIEEWIFEHPNITTFVRTVRRHNPRDSIDDDREEMRALGARIKEEKFTGDRGRPLDLQDNPAFEEKLEGLASGDVDVSLVAREGPTRVRYTSKSHVHETYVDDFGDDLVQGMELVLAALREFSSRQNPDPAEDSE